MANNLQKELKALGLKDGKIRNIGFVCDDLSPGQMSFLLTTNVNKYVESTVACCFHVFMTDWLPPSIKVKFPIYHIKDLYAFKGDTFLMSKTAVLASRDVYVSKKWYYCYDVNELNDPSFVENLKESNIPITARNKDHEDFIKAKGLSVRYIVEDINISSLLEVINAEEKQQVS